MIFEKFDIAFALLGEFQKFSKMHLGNLFPVALPNMWLLVLIQSINIFVHAITIN